MERDHPLLPFAATLLGVALFSAMDALMKGASIEAGAYTALLLRSGIGFALTGPAWWFTCRNWPEREVLRIHVVRGLVVTAMAFTFFWALVRLPLAEAIALSFTAPLVALGLAALLLGERIGRKAWLAGLLGLAGVALIVAARTGTPHDHPESAWGIAALLFSSFLYAWNLILQRQQAVRASPVEVVAFQNGIVGLALLIFLPWFLVWPTGEVLLDIGAAAVLAVVALMALAWAYARAEAQALVPLEYSGFLWASLFGWLFFGEAVALATWVGAALIVAGCILAAPRKPPEQTVA